MNHTPKSPFERVILSRWFLFCLLGIAIIIAVGYARAYYEDYQVRQEVQGLQQEFNKLEKKKFASLELLNYVKSDAFVEEKARTEFNLKKPGENILAIPADTSGKANLPPIMNDKQDNSQPLNNAWKWWYYFMPRRT